MSIIARRYAEAYFSLSQDSNNVEKHKSELKEINNLFSEIENLKLFFLSEQISKNDKKKLLTSSLQKAVSKETLNFLLLLVDKNRIGIYDEIINEYIHLANNELNIKEGIIESVRPLVSDKVNELEKTLSKDGQKIELSQKINKSLISGFKIKFDNYVIDGSMKSKLDKLQESISRKGDQSWI